MVNCVAIWLLRGGWLGGWAVVSGGLISCLLGCCAAVGWMGRLSASWFVGWLGAWLMTRGFSRCLAAM